MRAAKMLIHACWMNEWVNKCQETSCAHASIHWGSYIFSLLMWEYLAVRDTGRSICIFWVHWVQMSKFCGWGELCRGKTLLWFLPKEGHCGHMVKVHHQRGRVTSPPGKYGWLRLGTRCAEQHLSMSKRQKWTLVRPIMPVLFKDKLKRT
jgi:hypothetical protein